jgi:hypothetical protein
MKTLLASLALALSSFAAEPSREWIDVTGRKITAAMIGKTETTVTVRMGNLSVATIALEKLSGIDQQYVRATDIHEPPVMLARTMKAESNEAGTQHDKRAVEVHVDKIEGRKLTVTIVWIGPSGNTVGVYKTETLPVPETGLVRFDVEYRGSGTGADYKGYAVALKDDAGVTLAKQGSIAPFVRFLP